MPTVRDGAAVISLPVGLVEGQIDAQVSDQIFWAMRAHWWNPVELSELPAYEAGPPREFRERTIAEVKPD